MAGTLSATVTLPSASVSRTAAFTATGLLDIPTMTAVVPISAALAGAGALTATNTPKLAVTAALSGSGTLTATQSQSYPLAAALTGTGALSATVAKVPPAFDAVGGISSPNTSVTSVTWTHTATAGAYVVVGIATTTGTSTISAMTYGSSGAMTLLGTIGYNNSTANGTLRLYGLNGVAGGAQTVTVTTSSANVKKANSTSFTNVASAGTAVTTFGNSASLSQATTCSANQIIAQAFGMASGVGAFTSVSGGTNRTNARAATTGLLMGDSTASATFAGTSATSGPYGGIYVVLS